MKSKIRVGIGYDIHPLESGRKLVLGGVNVPFDKGLDGWSDADVLVHAVIDALLGAAALGDIGSHFPPGKAKYKDVSSLTLLKKVQVKLAAGGWGVVNIDATVVAEQPKLRDFVNGMRRELCRALEIPVGRVSVKASTSNGLGVIGRGEGIAAYGEEEYDSILAHEVGHNFKLFHAPCPAPGQPGAPYSFLDENWPYSTGGGHHSIPADLCLYANSNASSGVSSISAGVS